MSRKVEIWVGFFMLLVILAVVFIALKMTDGAQFKQHKTYEVAAIFEDIGGLKVRSPVKIGGVVVGRVTDIRLKDYKPYVSLAIDSEYNTIPSSSLLGIKTSGILGEQYIAIHLGLDNAIGEEIDALDFDENDGQVAVMEVQKTMPDYLEQGFVVTNTTSALVLEDLISQFLYSTDKKDSNH